MITEWNFSIDCDSNWVVNSNPNFTLLDTIARCKTVCATLAYIDTTCWPSSFYVTGMAYGQRALSTSCNLILNSINELSAQSGISIYPTLIDKGSDINISLEKNIAHDLIMATGEHHQYVRRKRLRMRH